MTFTRRVSFELSAEFGHRDVTPEVAACVTESGVREGIACVQLVGSTGAVTTIEYEPGALADLRRAVEQLAPADGEYAHNERWHDGNGFSHVRSALLKTGISIPILDGGLQLEPNRAQVYLVEGLYVCRSGATMEAVLDHWKKARALDPHIELPARYQDYFRQRFDAAELGALLTPADK